MMRAFLEFRFDNALTLFKERIFRKGGSNLITAFGASLYSNAGTSYKLPDSRSCRTILGVVVDFSIQGRPGGN